MARSPLVRSGWACFTVPAPFHVRQRERLTGSVHTTEPLTGEIYQAHIEPLSAVELVPSDTEIQEVGTGHPRILVIEGQP